MNRNNILLVYYALSQMVFGSQTRIHYNNYNFIMKRELEVKEVSSTSNYLNVSPYYTQRSKEDLEENEMSRKKVKYDHYIINFSDRKYMVKIEAQKPIFFHAYVGLFIDFLKERACNKANVSREEYACIFYENGNKADQLISELPKFIPILRCFTKENFKGRYDAFINKRKNFSPFLSQNENFEAIKETIFTALDYNPYDILMFSIFYEFVSGGFRSVKDQNSEGIFIIYYDRVGSSDTEYLDLNVLLEQWKKEKIIYDSVYEAYIFLVSKYYKCYGNRYNDKNDLLNNIRAFKWTAYNSLCDFFYSNVIKG